MWNVERPQTTLRFHHVILICSERSPFPSPHTHSQQKNVNPFKCVNTAGYRHRHQGTPSKPFNLLWQKGLRIGNRRRNRSQAQTHTNTHTVTHICCKDINLIRMQSVLQSNHLCIYAHICLCMQISVGCHNNFINNFALRLSGLAYLWV